MDNDRQQDKEIAALVESNKAIQRSLDEFRRIIERIESTMNDRARDSQAQRESIVSRLVKVETENSLIKKVMAAFGTATAGAVVLSLWQLMTAV